MQKFMKILLKFLLLFLFPSFLETTDPAGWELPDGGNLDLLQLRNSRFGDLHCTMQELSL